MRLTLGLWPWPVCGVILYLFRSIFIAASLFRSLVFCERIVCISVSKGGPGFQGSTGKHRPILLSIIFVLFEVMNFLPVVVMISNDAEHTLKRAFWLQFERFESFHSGRTALSNFCRSFATSFRSSSRKCIDCQDQLRDLQTDRGASVPLNPGSRSWRRSVDCVRIEYARRRTRINN